ncbi:glycosyltransferase family 4 protein [Glaciimonas sp. PAMC28666]|uniref:glycosyltransferase family 4 protein n=1 Tax=Glaciimonas sp. PAMC28666 TaxID=2807626 RepID=UPI001962923E|nr:glycosyltransferase family 4 protein [Glaciimonas sp. PAMC28666]QRX84568.1 glycosyltransferase family 4 protein [Glaciimonas sp. PAMC28666]
MASSAAVQLRDLAQEMLRQGHSPMMMIPSSDLTLPWSLETMDGVPVLRLKAPRTKDIGYLRRTIGEFLMPFAMLRSLRKSPFGKQTWDGVVWYSPTIFLGPIAKALKKASGCRSYLIVRDIFPEWAVDMGLLGRGLPYRFFKMIERYQYAAADTIGVQTQANMAYFDAWASKPGRDAEVLQNWLSDASDIGCSISVKDSVIAGRTIFVYAGNMGVAQGMGILIDLVERLRDRNDIGFLFVGRGSDVQLIRKKFEERKLLNVVLYDEIAPIEIRGLYAQCHIGIVALDPRHKTHNIPGKFLSYMQAGLPVLASINAGNDLDNIITRENVGRVCTDHSVETLKRLAEDLVSAIAEKENFAVRCNAVTSTLFSTEVAVKRIVNGLKQSSD